MSDGISLEELAAMTIQIAGRQRALTDLLINALPWGLLQDVLSRLEADYKAALADQIEPGDPQAYREAIREIERLRNHAALHHHHLVSGEEH